MRVCSIILPGIVKLSCKRSRHGIFILSKQSFPLHKNWLQSFRCVFILFIYYTKLILFEEGKNANMMGFLHQISLEQSVLIMEKILCCEKVDVFFFTTTSKTVWDEPSKILWVATYNLINKPSTNFCVNFAHLTWIYENLLKFMCFKVLTFKTLVKVNIFTDYIT